MEISGFNVNYIYIFLKTQTGVVSQKTVWFLNLQLGYVCIIPLRGHFTKLVVMFLVCFSSFTKKLYMVGFVWAA